MSINIDTFKNFVYAVANKNGKGTVTPDTFNLFTQRALNEWTSLQFSNEEQYQPNFPVARYGYEMTTKMMDNQSYYKEVHEINPDSDGKFSKPNGTTKSATGVTMPKYRHFSSARAIYEVYEGTTDDDILPCGRSPKKDESRYVIQYEEDVTLVKDHEVGSYLSSSIVYPDVYNPICAMYSDFFQVFPKKGVQKVKFTYLREPEDPKWGYTTQNGRPVYDSSSSVDIDAPNEAFNKIAMGVLSFLGVNLREQQLLQYSETMKQKGV